ncbi:MAG: MFS transporter [Verrucomicrobia bacterium]|nr:MFS transporter [Verrucomicrobiota bacterium]
MMSLAIGLNLLPVFLNSLRESFGTTLLTLEQLGRLGALAFTGLCVGIVVTGPLVDRWGAKLFVQIGNVLIAISLVGMIFVPTYTTLGFAVFVLGLGAGILDMVLSPVVAALNPDNRSSAMNWLHSFYCVGAVVTISAGTVVLQMGWGWRTACFVLLPLPLALFGLFARMIFPSIVSDEKGRTFGTILKQKWFLGAMVAIFLGGATELGMAQWLPAYAESALGFPQWISGIGLLLFSVAMAAGRMLVGAFGSKLDPFQTMAWGCGSSVVFFLAGSFLPIYSLALSACVLAGFTGSCLWPTMLAVTADRYPDGGASMFGALAALGNAGGIFMPWTVGWIAGIHDLHIGLAISALAPLLMLPVVLGLSRSAHPHQIS